MRTPRAAPQTILPHIRRGEESIYLCLRTCLSAPLICLKSETHVQTLLASRDFLYLIPQAKPNGLRPNTIHHKSRAKMISALGCLYSLQLGTGSQQPDRLIPLAKGLHHPQGIDGLKRELLASDYCVHLVPGGHINCPQLLRSVLLKGLREARQAACGQREARRLLMPPKAL